MALFWPLLKFAILICDGSGKFYTILDAYPHYPSETTGLALSPDRKRVYFAL